MGIFAVKTTASQERTVADKGEKAQVQRIDEGKDQVTVELYEATVPIPVTVRGDQIRVLDSEER